jgi:formamidopyrimidine-DNA glycosylase
LPELPEVEVVRAGLAPHLLGRTIKQVRVLHPRAVRRHLLGAEDFANALAGRTFAEPRRRGKYLWFPFEQGPALLAHLGMSGQLLVDGESPHARVIFDLDDGSRLVFADQRTFGGMWLASGRAPVPEEISHIAPDLFEIADLEPLAARMATGGRAVKRLLLDQTVVSGIGNIYADEALWLAKTHYLAPAETLGQTGMLAVLRAAREVMAQALSAGGTSFDALYVNAAGEPGYFGRELAVYGREGQPCRRCAAAIVREPFMGRSSFRCPSCQAIG